MNDLSDEIESILYIAREVMGAIFPSPLRLLSRLTCLQCIRSHLEVRLRDTKQPTGTSKRSYGKGDYESWKLEIAVNSSSR
jgi:hypothetical protein